MWIVVGWVFGFGSLVGLFCVCWFGYLLVIGLGWLGLWLFWFTNDVICWLVGLFLWLGGWCLVWVVDMFNGLIDACYILGCIGGFGFVCFELGLVGGLLGVGCFRSWVYCGLLVGWCLFVWVVCVLMLVIFVWVFGCLWSAGGSRMLYVCCFGLVCLLFA